MSTQSFQPCRRRAGKPCRRYDCRRCGPSQKFFAAQVGAHFRKANPEWTRHLEITITHPAFNGDIDREIGWNLHLGELLTKVRRNVIGTALGGFGGATRPTLRFIEPHAGFGVHVHYLIALDPKMIYTPAELERSVIEALGRISVEDQHYQWDELDRITGEIFTSSTHRFGRVSAKVRDVPASEISQRLSTNGTYASKDLQKPLAPHRDDHTRELREALGQRADYQNLRQDDPRKARKVWRNVGLSQNRFDPTSWGTSIADQRSRYAAIKAERADAALVFSISHSTDKVYDDERLELGTDHHRKSDPELNPDSDPNARSHREYVEHLAPDPPTHE